MGGLLDDILGRPVRAAGGDCRIVPVTNRLLGESVTVSGLLAGRDIVETLGRVPTAGRVLLPPNCINEEGRLLDDMHPEDLARESGLDVRVAAGSTASLIGELTR